ncbi:MAG: acetyl-CoA carboxylase carboxyltransferase subunit alpha [Saprospiraceae bacterium]
MSTTMFLDFEKPLEALYEQLEKIKQVGIQGEVDVTDTVTELEEKIKAKRSEIYAHLSGWQKVQLSRHPDRPYSLFYIEQMCTNFVELHGDRNIADDKAIIGGLGDIDGKTFMIIGHQKGNNTKMRQYRNFGMANPEGYRKALRLMKMAERFGFPVITLIDTPGAFPGLEAEERGQAEAIARNLFEMAQLKVPIICYIIGEGASGGAVGIGVGDRVFMLEYTWYSVISPESCSSILWHSWDFREQAADALKLTADDMYNNKLIDGIVREPVGGAHGNPELMAKILKDHILKTLSEVKFKDTDDLVNARIQKYAAMGEYTVESESEPKSKKSGSSASAETHYNEAIAQGQDVELYEDEDQE